MTTVEQQPMAELLKTATFGIFIVKGEERKRLSFMPLLMARGWDELMPTVMRAAVTRHTTLSRNNTVAYLSDHSNWLDREAAAAAGVSTTWTQGMKAGLTVLGIQLGHTDEYIQVQQIGDVADAEAAAQQVPDALKTGTFVTFTVEGEEQRRASFLPATVAHTWDDVPAAVLELAELHQQPMDRNVVLAFLSDPENWQTASVLGTIKGPPDWTLASASPSAMLTSKGIRLADSKCYIQVQRLGTAKQQTVPELLFDKLFWVNTSSLMSSLGLGFRAPIIAKGWIELTSVICDSIAKCREPLIWADVAKSLENPDSWQKDSKGAPTRLPELVVDKAGRHMSIAVMTPQTDAVEVNAIQAE